MICWHSKSRPVPEKISLKTSGLDFLHFAGLSAFINKLFASGQPASMPGNFILRMHQ
jgi:hypothetical protein